MDVALMLALVALFPPACLGLLLWLTRLEETLPQSVRAASREPDPPPILSVPVREGQPPAVPGVRIPAQRTSPALALPQTQAFSRSAAASLGGSTNR